MTDNNRNDQSQQADRTQQGTGNNQQTGNAEGQNPQDGAQWDNYRSREYSSEGGEKIKKEDVEEAFKDAPQSDGNNA